MGWRRDIVRFQMMFHATLHTMFHASLQMVYAKGETLSRSSDDGRGHVDWLAILVGHSGLIKGGARPKRI